MKTAQSTEYMILTNVSETTVREEKRNGMAAHTCGGEEKGKQRVYPRYGRNHESAEVGVVLGSQQATDYSGLKRRGHARTTHLRGTRTSKMAFSCTCQPNMYDVKPHKVNAVTNDLYEVLVQSLPI